MAKANIINKLVLQLDGKEVELSMAQAKELHAALNELFETKTIIEREVYPYPRPYYVAPRWHDPALPFTTWCSASGSTTGTLTDTTTGNALTLNCNS